MISSKRLSEILKIQSSYFMKKILSLPFIGFVCFLSFQLNAQTGTKKTVLFLGNSYTSVNNLPQLIQKIAEANGDTLIFDANTPGGQTLQQHTNNATSIEKINAQKWDIVVIQAQSQEPSFPPQQVASQTTPYALKLDSIVKANNPCTTTAFYETWGRKNGDPNNCQFYPPLCTYEGMQDRLKESYKLFADNCESIVVPAGEAWRQVIQTNTAINLYQADESHPSMEGSYLVACVFYEVLFSKSAVGTSFVSNLNSEVALFLQQTAHDALIANMDYSNIGKFHPCDTTTATSKETILSNSIVLFPNPAKDILTVTFDKNQFTERVSYTISDALGRTYAAKELNSASTIDISNLPSGIYFISFSSKGKTQILSFSKE